MGRPKLTKTELSLHQKNVKKCCDLIEKYEMGEGMIRRMIRTRLLFQGFERSEIREALSVTPRFCKLDRCIQFLQQEFNGKLVSGRKIVAAGERAGYSHMTIHRSLKSIAVLKTVNEYGKKRKRWKFDWMTERRNFEEE